MSFSFRPLEAASKPFYDEVMSSYPTHSDFHFTGAFVWDSAGTAQFATEDDALIIDIPSYHGTGRQLSFLARRGVADVAHQLLDFAEAEYGIKELRLVSDWMVDELGDGNGFRSTEDPDNADYLFSAARLASLRGKRFKGKAAKADACEARYDAVVRALNLTTAQARAAVEGCFADWCGHVDQSKEDIQDEGRALSKLLDHASDLTVEALGVFVDDALVGFTIYEVVPSVDGAVCQGHFQKADRRYTGATEMMMRALGSSLLEREVETVNWEQDLGVPGLRQAKRAYLPVDFRRKFTVTR